MLSADLSLTEQTIVTLVVDILLDDGWELNLQDGYGDPRLNRFTRNRDVILGELGATGIDWLLARKRVLATTIGAWVQFVYGNDIDVIGDYTTNLEETLRPVNRYIDTLE